MAGYSHREQVDIIFTYSRANSNGREAAQQYRVAFPEKRQPSHRNFFPVCRRVTASGSESPWYNTD